MLRNFLRSLRDDLGPSRARNVVAARNCLGIRAGQLVRLFRGNRQEINILAKGETLRIVGDLRLLQEHC